MLTIRNGNIASCQYAFVAVFLVLSACLPSLGVQAASAPICPGSNKAPYPSSGKVDDSPVVKSWVELPALPQGCHIQLQTPAALSIALAGQFTHSGSAEEIALRLGAVSSSKGLLYWSVSDDGWRELVSDAFAVDSAAKDTARPDFTAAEMLSGQTLYFAQNDTRSWGTNIYSLRAISSSSDHLVFASDNVSPIRLGPITLFQPDELRSVMWLDRVKENTWSYFSLAVITHDSLAAREKSLINRQAAFYRLLVGQTPDQSPPLAP